MSTNLFAALKRLLPPSPVWIGEVVAHNASDDTSTLRLPTEQGTIPYAGAVQGGSLIRARGRTVPIGQNAFVRDGVVETVAPSGTPLTFVVAPVVTVPGTALAFNGPISAQSYVEDAAITALNLDGYWVGGSLPRSWSVVSGTLPPGLSLNELTGVVSGTPTTPAAAANVTFRCTDGQLSIADGAVSFTVTEDWSTFYPNDTPENAYIFAFMTLTTLSNWADVSSPPTILTDAQTRNLARLFTGGVAPLTYAIQAPGALQPGLTLSSAGIISGNPTALHPSINVTVVATDSTGASRSLLVGTATLTPERYLGAGGGGSPTSATVFSQAVSLTLSTSAPYTHSTYGILVRDVTLAATWGPLTWTDGGGTHNASGTSSGSGTAWSGIGLDSRTDAQLLDDILTRSGLGTSVLPADPAALPVGAEPPATIDTLDFTARVNGTTAPGDTQTSAYPNRQIAAASASNPSTLTHSTVIYYRYVP